MCSVLPQSAVWGHNVATQHGAACVRGVGTSPRQVNGPTKYQGNLIPDLWYFHCCPLTLACPDQFQCLPAVTVVVVAVVVVAVVVAVVVVAAAVVVIAVVAAAAVVSAAWCSLSELCTSLTCRHLSLFSACTSLCVGQTGTASRFEASSEHSRDACISFCAVLAEHHARRACMIHCMGLLLCMGCCSVL